MAWPPALLSNRGQKVFAFVCIVDFLVFFALNLILYWKTEDHDMEYDTKAYALIQATTLLCSAGAFISILLKLYKVTDEGLCYAVYSLTQAPIMADQLQKEPCRSDGEPLIIAVIILFTFIAASGIHYAWDPPLLKVVWILDILYVPWAVFCFAVHYKGRQQQRINEHHVEPMPDPDA